MQAIDTGRVLIPSRQPPAAARRVQRGFGIESSSRKGRVIPSHSQPNESKKESMGVLSIPSRRHVLPAQSKPETPFDRATAEQLRYYGGKSGEPVIGVKDPGTCKSNLQGSIAVQSAIGGFDAPGLRSGTEGSSIRPQSASERRQYRNNRSNHAAEVIGIAVGAATRSNASDGPAIAVEGGAGLGSDQLQEQRSRQMTSGGIRPTGKRQLRSQQSSAVWSAVSGGGRARETGARTEAEGKDEGEQEASVRQVKRGRGARYAALLKGAQAAALTGIGPQAQPQAQAQNEGGGSSGGGGGRGHVATASHHQGGETTGAAGLEIAARGRQARARGIPTAPTGQDFVSPSARPDTARSQHYNRHLRSQHGTGGGTRGAAPWGTEAPGVDRQWRTASQDAMSGRRLAETAGSVHPRGGKAMVAGSSFGVTGEGRGAQSGLKASLGSGRGSGGGRRRIFSTVNNPYKQTSIY